MLLPKARCAGQYGKYDNELLLLCVVFLNLLSICVCFLDLHCICFLQLWQINSFVILWKPLWEIGPQKRRGLVRLCIGVFLFLPFSFLIDGLDKPCYRVLAKSVRSGLPLVVPVLPGSQRDSFSALVSFAPVSAASKSLDLGPRWWLVDVWLYYNCYIWYVLNWVHCDHR